MPIVPFSNRSLRDALLIAVCATICLSPAFADTPKPDLFEIGQTSTGNYLAALIASDDRDSGAAARYYREALRFDPSDSPRQRERIVEQAKARYAAWRNSRS